MAGLGQTWPPRMSALGHSRPSWSRTTLLFVCFTPESGHVRAQTPDVIAQRRQVLKALDLRAGEQVLDIGSGPGLLAYEMAVSVGQSGRVCGIDTSEDMFVL